MSRQLPLDCPHGAILDWGDFGCQEDDCYGTCDLCPPEHCEFCNPTFVEEADANPERRGNGCQIYRVNA